MTRRFAICVPARNEADRIGTLIDALADQSIAGLVRVALCVNNSDDDTIGVARRAADRSEGRIDLAIAMQWFDPALAHAGSARRVAMDLGARLLDDGEGVLLSTDADCRPPGDWIEANLAACVGDRIVGGRIELDDREPIERCVRDVRKRFDRYWCRVREIEDAIDPIAWDPPPRHGDHTGASLALTVDLYRRSGGVPAIPTGEDRALVAAAIAAGGRLSHPIGVWTRASARTAGRAAGGMAIEIADWIARDRADEGLRVPSFDRWRARADWRRGVRDRAGDAAIWSEEHTLAAMACDMVLPEFEP